MRWREQPPPPEVAFQRLWATRNFALLLIAGGSYITWQGIDGWNQQRVFRSAALTSLGGTLTLLGLGIMWTYLDAAVLHRNEPMEYWKQRERRTRPKVILGTQVVAVAAILTVVVALALNLPALAGVAAVPAVFAGFLTVANWTGGIQPLFPEQPRTTGTAHSSDVTPRPMPDADDSVDDEIIIVPSDEATREDE